MYSRQSMEDEYDMGPYGLQDIHLRVSMVDRAQDNKTWARVWRCWDKSYGWVPLWQSNADGSSVQNFLVWTCAEQKALPDAALLDSTTMPEKPPGYYTHFDDLPDWEASNKDTWQPTWKREEQLRIGRGSYTLR